MTKTEALNNLVKANDAAMKAVKDENTYIFERATTDAYFYARLFVLLDLEEQGKRKGKKRNKKDAEHFNVVLDFISSVERDMQMNVNFGEMKKCLESESD